MAFNPALLIKQQPDSLLTQPATIPTIAISPLPPQQWLYNGNADTIATIMTAGYFNVFANWTNTLEYDNGQFFRVGDNIYIVAVDGNAFIQVTAVGTTITTGSLPPGPLSVTNADVAANAAIAFSKLAALTSGHILVGSAGNVATNVAMSGDATISNAGALTVAASAITGAKIAAATIQGANIASNTITGGDLVNNTITATQLALSVPQIISVPITSANFKTAFTAGLACIAAPGAGKLIVIDNVNYSINFLTASYTAGGAVSLQYSTAAPVNANGVDGVVTVAAATVNGVAANSQISVAGALAINLSSAVVNQGVWLTVATQNFATGAGALVVNIHYHVVTA